MNRRDRPWHQGDAVAVLRRLDGQEDGLTAAAVAARRREYGANVLPQAKRPGLLVMLLRQFRNPLVYLLLAAAAVSLAVDQILDAVFIFGVLVVNAAIGAAQEWQAQKSAARLDRLIQHRTVVRRDGRWEDIPAHDLVPGDVVRVDRGLQVGADLRLLAGADLRLDESLLTGESQAVAKQPIADLATDTPLGERSNMVHAGTTVLAGRGRGVVVATALATEIGRIAETLRQEDPTPPPLLKQLDRFSRVIGLATMVLIVLIAAAMAAQGAALATVFLIAIALAVAAIPEGLPVAITIALTIAVNRMHRRQVIVRSLPAVEGLGACTLIASDKTGTLTCNEMTVKALVPFVDGSPGPRAEVGGAGYAAAGAVTIDGSPPDDGPAATLRLLAESAALCNEASIRFTDTGADHLGDTVDVAFLVLAVKLGLEPETLRKTWHDVGLVPYEPERRYGAVLATIDGERAVIAHVKGAPEALAPMCADIDPACLLAEADRMAEQGYRVLAVARGTVDPGRGADPVPAADSPERALRGLTLLGLVGLIDPVRPEVPAAVEQCRAAGISVRMITGDHPTTALAVARQLGIAEDRGEVASEAELQALAGDPGAFTRFVAGKRVFARVEPVQKLAIVEALQRGGHVVAVTGDGVNDAPALNAADIGVAMGRSGTDVARSAADLVLADDNFASIVGGIEEGRIAYDNIRKLIYLLIATGLGEIVLFVGAILFALPPPLFAVQLLWLNLVTNGIQDVALAFERGEPGIGLRPPRPLRAALFDRRMAAQVMVAGLYMGGMSFIAYAWFLGQGMEVAAARNLVLLLMVLFENAHALNARSERRSVFGIPFAANPFLLVAVIGAQAIHVAAMFLPGFAAVLGVQPIGFLDWIVVAVLGASLVLVMEIYKRVTARLFQY